MIPARLGRFSQKLALIVLYVSLNVLYLPLTVLYSPVTVLYSLDRLIPARLGRLWLPDFDCRTCGFLALTVLYLALTVLYLDLIVFYVPCLLDSS